MAFLTTTPEGQPVLILKEGTSRSRGKEAQKSNIAAALAVADTIKTTLGPRGMDKMLIDSMGDITITNDGATILDEMDVGHPAAKMMVEIAKTQDDMVGDGTTTVVVMSGELLRKAEDLLEQNIHPTVIVSGYQKAVKKAVEVLESVAVPVDLGDRETLKKVAMTSMRSKAVGASRDFLADIAVDAVNQVSEKRGDSMLADIDNIQVVKKEGKSIHDTTLVKGVILDKEVVHAGMPKRVEKAKIALLNAALEVEKTEMSAEIRIRDPSQMKAFLDKETSMLSGMVEKIAASGTNVLVCQKGIDDMAQHFLAKHKILAIRRAKESDIEKLSRATGGKVVTSIDDLKPGDLGHADIVEERKIGDDKMVFVEGCKDPKSVSLLIRAGLERMVDEAERAMKDALSVVADVVEKNKIVAGGGAIEAEIAKELRRYATKVGGREQMAISAFADAVEVIPKVLSDNAGLGSIDVLVNLRAAHENPKGQFMGVDVFSGKIIDMYKEGVLEPLSVKEHAVKSAAEAASMILRIDDIVAASKPKEQKGPPNLPEGEY